MCHSKNGLAAKFTIFIFTRRWRRLTCEHDCHMYSGIGTGDKIRGEPAIRR
jgi:hypothetical protein